MSDPTPGSDAPDFPDNDRSYLEDVPPTEVDATAVAAHEHDDEGDEGWDADAARD